MKFCPHWHHTLPETEPYLSLAPLQAEFPHRWVPHEVFHCKHTTNYKRDMLSVPKELIIKHTHKNQNTPQVQKSIQTEHRSLNI